MMIRIIALLAAAATGCGAVIDGAYLLGARSSTSRSEESAPTPERAERVEVEGSLAADGSLELQCFQRARAIERSWYVDKTYRRRGGFSRKAYSSAAIADALIGGVVLGVIAAACHSDDSSLSCWNMMYAAPFAVDAGYSLARSAFAKDAVLVSKRRGRDELRFAAPPISETETHCESISSVWLGTARGPSDIARLRGQDRGQKRELAENAIPLPLIAPTAPDAPDAPDDAATPAPVAPPLTVSASFGIDALSAWAQSKQTRVWAVDGAGVPHEVAVDRCAVLRRSQSLLSPEARKRLETSCPKPQATH